MIQWEKQTRRSSQELGAEVIEIDITDDSSVNKGVAIPLKKLGARCVDFSNNVDWNPRIQEAYTPDDWKKIYEITSSVFNG